MGFHNWLKLLFVELVILMDWSWVWAIPLSYCFGNLNLFFLLFSVNWEVCIGC